MTYLTSGYGASNSTTAIWGAWNNSTTTATSTTANNAWGYWVDQGTASTSVTWTQWAGAATSGTVILGQHLYQPKPLSAEQIEQQKLAAAEAMRKEQERQAKVTAAKEKAEQLLLAHLTEEQERAWKEERAIFVTGQSGKRYKIKDGHGGNLTELNDKGEAVRGFCVHVDCKVPSQDNVLAQKLALEYSEEALLHVANSWRIENGRRM